VQDRNRQDRNIFHVTCLLLVAVTSLWFVSTDGSVSVGAAFTAMVLRETATLADDYISASVAEELFELHTSACASLERTASRKFWLQTVEQHQCYRRGTGNVSGDSF